ncbi:hypothetical protein [Streptomyces sp. NPDC014734]|uniref:hypothetical protein n=1 Tax=Streptomyces sp. NPDC014734 TaxID=3364886 RepID=UPI0036F6D69D
MRGCGTVLLACTLLAACSGARENPRTAATSTGPGGGPKTAPSDNAGSGSAIDADPARLPTTREAALALIGKVIANPEDFGPGVVARTPYESGPDTWPVLGADCVWWQQPPGRGVLATLTRSVEMPATKDKGPLRLAAIMTVHRADDGARWEMAESLEETMRCPTQQLRQGEFIGGLDAKALARGEANQVNSDDSLMESGQYRSDELGGPHPYFWAQDRILRFTFAVTARGAKGWRSDEIDSIGIRAQSAMLIRLGDAITKRG